MKKLSLLFEYLTFLLQAKNEHSIHSPFVFNLYTTAIAPKTKTPYYCYRKIEELRTLLLQSEKIIRVKDYGAGSKHLQGNERKVKDIAGSSLKSPLLSQLLFRLAIFSKPKVVVDLGTSLGVTTMYYAYSNKKTKVYTFEGCPETAQIALTNFKKLRLDNIDLTLGNLDETLEVKLNEVDTIDFAFFDANHRKEPTLNYFNLCLSKAHEQSLFIFDDIHWSYEMEEAWEEIKAHPKVLITIDLFFIGLVFFRTNQPKQHFKLWL